MDTITAELSPLAKKLIHRKIELTGITDIMFDRYPGDNRTQLEAWQKVYLIPNTRTLCIPSLNIISALTAENTNSFPRVLLDPRKYKTFCRAILSYTSISEAYLPILNDKGSPIQLGTNLEGDRDPVSGVYIHRTVARLKDGIPNPKVRPVLPAPWKLRFEMTLFPNSAFQEQELRNIISQGGLAVGLGTFRGAFGKFEITRWE